MVTLANRVLFVGFGAVARCTLPILIKHVSIDPTRITIMDFEPNDDALKPWIEQGMTFIKGSCDSREPGELGGTARIERRPPDRPGVGCGFPAHYDDTVPPLRRLAKMINAELDRLFPEPIEILAEPGQFLVASSATA
jgi:hypothetical protein